MQWKWAPSALKICNSIHWIQFKAVQDTCMSTNWTFSTSEENRFYVHNLVFLCESVCVVHFFIWRGRGFRGMKKSAEEIMCWLECACNEISMMVSFFRLSSFWISLCLHQMSDMFGEFIQVNDRSIYKLHTLTIVAVFSLSFIHQPIAAVHLCFALVKCV